MKPPSLHFGERERERIGYSSFFKENWHLVHNLSRSLYQLYSTYRITGLKVELGFDVKELHIHPHSSISVEYDVWLIIGIMI